MEEYVIQLSERLELIASFVTKGYTVADIGTDHAHVPIYLIQNNITSKAFAMDINKGPIEIAKQNINNYGLSDKIEVRLSNGLKELKRGEAESVIIAGMGGRLIIKILDEGAGICSDIKELILSPHSESDLVREYLCKNGFTIRKEKMILDDDKYYTVINAVHGTMQYEKLEFLRFGELPLINKDNVLKQYLISEKEKYESILEKISDNDGTSIHSRKEDIHNYLEIISVALTYYI